MSPIIKRKGEKFTLPGKYLLFILTILCIGLIVLTFNTNLLSAPVSAVGGFLITPLQNGISKAGSLISSRTEELVQIRSLLKENEELKAQIDEKQCLEQLQVQLYAYGFYDLQDVVFEEGEQTGDTVTLSVTIHANKTIDADMIYTRKDDSWYLKIW